MANTSRIIIRSWPLIIRGIALSLSFREKTRSRERLTFDDEREPSHEAESDRVYPGQY